MTNMTFNSEVFDGTYSGAQGLRELISALELRYSTLYQGCKEDHEDDVICQHGTYCRDCSQAMTAVQNELESAKSLLPLWEELEDHFSIAGLDALLEKSGTELNLLIACYSEHLGIEDYNYLNDTAYTLDGLKTLTQVIEFSGGILVKNF